MGVLKNDVGRPSNKTIIIRKLLKAIFLLLVIGLAILVGYNLNKEETNFKKNEKQVSTTQSPTKEETTFDDKQVITKSIGEYGIFENAIEVYVYGNKINSNKYTTDEVISITPIEDVAVIELHSDFNILLLVNKKGEVLYDFELDNGYYYCSDNLYSNECYSYKVDNNTIKYMVADLGQDIDTACVTNKDKNVLIEYEITYKDGKLSKPKELSSMTGKEYAQKHNINCSE